MSERSRRRGRPRRKMSPSLPSKALVVIVSPSVPDDRETLDMTDRMVHRGHDDPPQKRPTDSACAALAPTSDRDRDLQLHGHRGVEVDLLVLRSQRGQQ